MSGLKYNELKNNIDRAIDNIPKQYYINLFNGAYKRDNVYKSRRHTRAKEKRRSTLAKSAF
jgi:hypothetical protein